MPRWHRLYPVGLRSSVSTLPHTARKPKAEGLPIDRKLGHFARSSDQMTPMVPTLLRPSRAAQAEPQRALKADVAECPGFAFGEVWHIAKRCKRQRLALALSPASARQAGSQRLKACPFGRPIYQPAFGKLLYQKPTSPSGCFAFGVGFGTQFASLRDAQFAEPREVANVERTLIDMLDFI